MSFRRQNPRRPGRSEPTRVAGERDALPGMASSPSRRARRARRATARGGAQQGGTAMCTAATTCPDMLRSTGTCGRPTPLDRAVSGSSLMKFCSPSSAVCPVTDAGKGRSAARWCCARPVRVRGLRAVPNLRSRLGGSWDPDDSCGLPPTVAATPTRSAGRSTQASDRLIRRRTDRSALTPKVDVAPRGESGSLGDHAHDASRRLKHCLDAQLRRSISETAGYQTIRRAERIGTENNSGCELIRPAGVRGGQSLSTFVFSRALTALRLRCRPSAARGASRSNAAPQ